MSFIWCGKICGIDSDVVRFIHKSVEEKQTTINKVNHANLKWNIEEKAKLNENKKGVFHHLFMKKDMMD